MRKEEEIRVLFDREVYDINKLDYHASMDIYANIDELKKRKSSLKKSLNGKWNVSYFKNASIEDLKNGIEIMPTKKGTVKVPCCLEFAGFGNPQYVNSQYPFDGHEDVSMGSTDFEYNTYYELSRDFLCIERVDRKKLGSKADEIFDDRDRFVLSFDGIEGAAFIYLNGEFVGYSENAFSPCEFDITDKIKRL